MSLCECPCHSFQVLIKVIDTNDHRPQFSTSKYEVAVPEDTEPEVEILQISAVDRDEKNKLIYTLQSSIDPASLKKFRLDPATGALYTAEKLDHEAIHQHVLTVMVRKAPFTLPSLFLTGRFPGMEKHSDFIYVFMYVCMCVLFYVFVCLFLIHKKEEPQ